MANIVQYKICTLCRAPADMHCQRCWDPYCSTICQQTDWPYHKKSCFHMPCLIKSTPGPDPELRAPEQQETVPALRPPNPTTVPEPPKLPSDANGDVKKHSNGEVKKSNSNGGLFDNPFKRNSKNVGFQSNNVTNTIDNNKAVNVDKMSDKPVNKAISPSHKDPIRKPGSFNQTSAKPEPMRVADTNAAQSKQNDSRSTTSIKSPVSPKVEPIEETLRAPSKASEIDPKTPLLTEASMIKVPPKLKVEPVETPMRLPGKAALKEPTKPLITPKLKENDSTDNNQVEVPVKVKPVEDKTQPKPKENISKIEPWMKPFPIEEKVFVSVIVQFVAGDKIWVMVEKNEFGSNNLLIEMNKGIAAAPTPDQAEIKINSIYRVPFEDFYYRGVILKPITADGTVLARLIDYGNEVIVPINKLKSAIPVMMNLNAFSFPIKFQKNRKTEIGDKLNIKIQSMKDGVMTVLVDEESPICTMNDIEVVPIPGGKKLYVLDFSNIMDGYISACVYDGKAIAQTDIISNKITDYCKGSTDAYTPQMNEVCLAKFDDGQWYRAVVQKVIDANDFEIVFIDYGNTATANSSNIRKIPKSFSHHCLMNNCYIKDFPKGQKNEIRKMAIFFSENPVFEVETVEKENEGYLIKPKF